MPERAPPYPTDYAVARDGQRFLINTVVDQPTRPALTAELWIAGNFTRENFDRDRAIEARVAGLVNLAHSTRAERA